MEDAKKILSYTDVPQVLLCGWVMDILTHSTNNNAVLETQRLPQNSELLCDLIGQLPV